MLIEDPEISDVVDIATFAPQFDLSLPRGEAAAKFAMETFQFWHVELGRSTPYHGMIGLTVNNRLTSTLGYCYIQRPKDDSGKDGWLSRIELAGSLVRKGTVDEIVCTIIHELGHAFCGVDEGHGDAWAAACDRMGLLFAKEYPTRPMTFKMTDNEWSSTCSCGVRYSFQRMTRKRKESALMCSKCGEKLPKFQRGIV